MGSHGIAPVWIKTGTETVATITYALRGDAHAEDDAHEHDHQSAEVEQSFADHPEDDIT
jgi:hypothetical protein